MCRLSRTVDEGLACLMLRSMPVCWSPIMCWSRRYCSGSWRRFFCDRFRHGVQSVLGVSVSTSSGHSGVALILLHVKCEIQVVKSLKKGLCLREQVRGLESWCKLAFRVHPDLYKSPTLKASGPGRRTEYESEAMWTAPITGVVGPVPIHQTSFQSVGHKKTQ